MSLLRSISAVPCHSFLGVIMAQYLLAFHQPAATAPHGPRCLQLLKAWLLPAMLHALYDLPLMTRAVTDEDQATSALFVTLVLALLAAWTRYLVAGFAQWHVAAAGAASRRSPE